MLSLTHKTVVEIRESVQSDVLPIAVNMRDEDAKEVWDSHLSSPYRALCKGMESKGKSWTIVVDGVPIGMVGVSHRSLLGNQGTPWLLGTRKLTDSKKLFLLYSKIILKNMSEGYDRLENYISVENKPTMRWLRYLGFEIGEEIKSVTGVPFKRFYKNVENN